MIYAKQVKKAKKLQRHASHWQPSVQRVPVVCVGYQM